MNSKSSDDARMVKQAMWVILIIMALVMLMDIVQFSLDDSLATSEPVVVSSPMTPWEQCMIWNKWSEGAYRGQCPGDLQGRWWQ